MSDEWAWAGIAGMAGVLLGYIWGSRMVDWYWRSKAPDAVGFRTAMCSGGKFYYVVTEQEYVNKVMGPLPDGSRVEIGNGFVRYTNMPPEEEK